MSESGNEKARKKPKKNQPLPSASTATASGSGQEQKLVKLKVPPEKFSQITSLTPSPVLQQGKKRKAAGEAGSGSGDDTAGEMSDSNGVKKQRVKLLSGGRALSPPAQGTGTGSRQSSPIPVSKSRPGSPNAPPGASRASSPGGTVAPGTRNSRIHKKRL